ncbi:MAG: hypothetical protein COB02_09485 [Candidatus Cloacimonadota bacterium]|nr:MAG: hypothetical protein COB02_09485 [Candidatus Cloacimonadota bacterium]
MSFTKKLAHFTIFFFLFQIIAPVFIYSIDNKEISTKRTELEKRDWFSLKKTNKVVENAFSTISEGTKATGSWLSELPTKVFRNSKNDAINFTPDQVQEIIDQSTTKTFEGNPILREENSTILRPIKQITLKVLDGEIGIVKSFLSYEASNFLKKAIVGGSSESKSKLAMIKAREVVSAMTSSQLKQVTKVFKGLNIPQNISKFLKKSPAGLNKFMASEANFAVMSVIGSFISMGIYDGLDVSTMKDKILALDPIQSNYTVQHSFASTLVGGSVNRHFYSFFNNKFDVFYDRLMSSKPYMKTLKSSNSNVFKHLLNKVKSSIAGSIKVLDAKSEVLGKKMFKASRLGIVQKESGQSLAAKLGLVGVGEGTAFSLKGLLKSISTGLAYGMVANLVIDTAIVGIKGRPDTLVVGGNRNKKTMFADYNSNRFQKSQSKVKNWFKERKFALLDLYDQYRKTPITKIVSSVTGFTGAYLGSVIAGAILVGGGIPAMVGGVMIASLFGGIGSFLGRWATLKFERGKTMKNVRRNFVVKRLKKAIKKMDIYINGEITDSRVNKLAEDRSQDMYKLESNGKVYNNMFFVKDIADIKVYKGGEFNQLQMDENLGENFDLEAHIRYNFIDIEGNEGRYDIVDNKLYQVGNIQENNGFDVFFVEDDEEVTVTDGKLLNKGNFRVLSNGIVMTLADFDKEKWVIKGINANTDMFLRNLQQRFTWNWDLKTYLSTSKISSVNASLNPYLALLSSEDIKVEDLTKFLRINLETNQEKSLKNLEKVSEENESDFFERLESNGVNQEQIKKFSSMDISEWKNILSGKIRRGAKNHSEKLISKLKEMTKDNLLSQLKLEIEDASNETVWDSVVRLSSQDQFIASYAK